VNDTRPQHRSWIKKLETPNGTLESSFWHSNGSKGHGSGFALEHPLLGNDTVPFKAEPHHHLACKGA
jgi:hypothetical protein